MIRPAFVVFAGVVAALVPASFSQSASKQAEVSAQARASLWGFLQSFDKDLKDRFVAVFADLNGDGRPEAIVHLTSNDWCGSGGCTTLILMRDRESWRLLTEVTLTRPPIRLLRSKSNGWRDIAVWIQGGGIQPGYEAELSFDGKSYAANPTASPAKPLKGKPEGEVLIARPTP